MQHSKLWQQLRNDLNWNHFGEGSEEGKQWDQKAGFCRVTMQSRLCIRYHDDHWVVARSNYPVLEAFSSQIKGECLVCDTPHSLRVTPPILRTVRSCAAEEHDTHSSNVPDSGFRPQEIIVGTELRSFSIAAGG